MFCPRTRRGRDECPSATSWGWRRQRRRWRGMYTCRIRRYTVPSEGRETYAYDFVQADRTRVLEFGVWSPRLCKTPYQGSRPRACFWQRYCEDARTWWTPQIRCIMGVVSWCCTLSRTGPVAVRDGDRRSRLTVRIPGYRVFQILLVPLVTIHTCDTNQEQEQDFLEHLPYMSVSMDVDSDMS